RLLLSGDTGSAVDDFERAITGRGGEADRPLDRRLHVAGDRGTLGGTGGKRGLERGARRAAPEEALRVRIACIALVGRHQRRQVIEEFAVGLGDLVRRAAIEEQEPELAVRL